MIDFLINLIVKRVMKEEAIILSKGRKLLTQERKDAIALGIKNPQKVRILEVDRVPIPSIAHFIGVFCKAQFPIVTAGVSYGYGIYVLKSRVNDRSLVAHELVHVRQQEEMGGVKNFVPEYIKECIKFGYSGCKFEMEAYRIDKDF